MKTSASLLTASLLGLALFCCLCACCLLFGAAFLLPATTSPTLYSTIEIVLGNTPAPPTATAFFSRPTPGLEATPQPPATDTLAALEEMVVPVSDLRFLAERLEGKPGIPETLPAPAVLPQVGDGQTFWASNTQTNRSYEVQATLRYVTDHLYFWVQDRVSYRERDLQALAEAFENEIYPTNRAFFGSEWTPGVDSDPRLYILYARGLGNSIAGYFSSADEYAPAAHEYSNAHEMFFLSADNAGLDEAYTYGVLAHEFQHMIHWYRDRNEETWMNEGFSEVAVFLNGYYSGGFDELYAENPDLQLNDWPSDREDTSPHYGAAFLFLAYFLDRFGEEATRTLVASPQNGMDSIDEILAGRAAPDPLRGTTPTADDLFQDWTLAMYLQDSLPVVHCSLPIVQCSEAVADGRYQYSNYPTAPQTSDTETIEDCPPKSYTRDVRQYGVDYIRFTCPGSYALQFTGSTEIPIVPTRPRSGSYAYWSNKGDESNMTLTRQFDFTGHAGPLTLSYAAWYDLETDYDYLYVEASTDGQTWQILTTPSGTAEDPSGNSFGWAYNGESGGWLQETVDLSAFAGQQVYVRFEYVTDAAVNNNGFLLDDVAIPEISYSTDFETGEDGWESAGWARITNLLPQTYRLALISFPRTGAPTINYLPLTPGNEAEIPITIDTQTTAVVLVVSGTTRFTTQPAGYQLELIP